MTMCVPLNARSEFAKSRAPAPGGAEALGAYGCGAPAGAVAFGTAGVGAGTWGVALVARSPGIARPEGFFGSTKPSGRGRVDTNSMPKAATPASLYPGFNPTRGSFGS